MTDPTTRRRRLEVCQTCEQRQVRPTKFWPKPVAVCGMCGCVLVLRVYRSCPMEKW